MHDSAAAISTHWHVRVRPASPHLDGHGRDILADVRQNGLSHVEAVHSSRIYLFRGNLTADDVRLIAEQLLVDPVCETFDLGRGLSQRVDRHPAIEVQAKPGVMNPPAISTLAATRRLLAAERRAPTVDEVQTARRYEIVGAAGPAELEQIASRILANGCIENSYIQGFGRIDAIPNSFAVPDELPFVVRRVSLRGLGDDALKLLSQDAHLFLSLEEMRAIRDHFDSLGRDPTDLELETLAQTWSEHCVHKTLKSAVEYRGDDFGRPGETVLRFDNLLKNTIVAATEMLDRPWCLSVFVDNAGIVAFDDDFGIAIKVETHNHPSAIEPYGGASTGLGGCIRDIMGCGLGAKPIASTDVFCLARPDFDVARLPAGVLHPRRVLKGVVQGVRDYGNRMGIPTVNGAIHFDDRYLANPLVFCGCVGLIPRNRIHKQVHSGDRIVVAGGRTGRDGIHGATFSSAELTTTHVDEFAHAVQIGNAIEEKKLLDALLLARDAAGGCLYSAVTDCGAGGLSSAVGEMGERLGAVVDLDRAPLKYAGLTYDEIWISEAQERMVFAVPPARLARFLSVFAAEEVEATVIGTFTDERGLRVRYRGETVGELAMEFLHHGRPRSTRTAVWTAPSEPGRRAIEQEPRANERLLAALRQWNTASKEWVIRQYDHEVQGRSVIKPLVGPGCGPSDAAVLRPRLDRYTGIALGCGLCPQGSDSDPYRMAIASVDEAFRNVLCVGADPDRVAILDNFCWPKTDTPRSLGGLVRTCVGARDAALAYRLPFVSGKDSLNNEFTMGEEEAKRLGLPSRLAIPGTLLITALGIVPDVRRSISLDLKNPGDYLVVASAPFDRAGLEGAGALHRRVARLVAGGKVRAAHDVSDGGVAAAIAEMCIAGNLGASIRLTEKTYAHSLFADAATTYVLAMAEADAVASEFPILGRVQEEPRLLIESDEFEPIDLAVSKLAEAWRSPLAAGGGR